MIKAAVILVVEKRADCTQTSGKAPKDSGKVMPLIAPLPQKFCGQRFSGTAALSAYQNGRRVMIPWIWCICGLRRPPCTCILFLTPHSETVRSERSKRRDFVRMQEHGCSKNVRLLLILTSCDQWIEDLDFQLKNINSILQKDTGMFLSLQENVGSFL